VTHLDNVVAHAMNPHQLRCMATRHRDMSRFVAMNARNDAAQRGLRGNRPAAAAQCP